MCYIQPFPAVASLGVDIDITFHHISRHWPRLLGVAAGPADLMVYYRSHTCTHLAHSAHLAQILHSLHSLHSRSQVLALPTIAMLGVGRYKQPSTATNMHPHRMGEATNGWAELSNTRCCHGNANFPLFVSLYLRASRPSIA